LDAEGTAEANLILANNARATAQAEKETANAASTAAVQALSALEANLEANLTAQARPPDTPVTTPTPTPSATPQGTPTLAVILAGSRTPTSSPTPTGTRTPTSTLFPTPTPNLAVIAQQTQLAEVRATQTRLASPPGPLAFVSDREGGISRLFRLNAPGSSSQAERLSLTEAYRPAVDVSARGNIVVFSTADRPEPGGQLVRILATVDERPTESRIPGDDESRWDPAISPDGSKVLFASPFDGNQDIFMINLDGSGIVNLTQSEVDENTPAWSPDGRRIAFSGKRVGGQSDIWVINRDGSGLERLTDHPNVDTYPAWSPDGTKIAFASTRDDPKNSRPDIYILDLETREVRNMTNTPLMDENFPAWSRDGAWLAFTRFTTNSEIFIIPSAGGEAINVTNNPAGDSYPAWW
jgi:TolB protein